MHLGVISSGQRRGALVRAAVTQSQGHVFVSAKVLILELNLFLPFKGIFVYQIEGFNAKFNVFAKCLESCSHFGQMPKFLMSGHIVS